jgi:hypothetical protein
MQARKSCQSTGLTGESHGDHFVVLWVSLHVAPLVLVKFDEDIAS